ncbi:MAG TPA: FAD-dependent monooxygenase [Gemmatimonadaceae bacterium]|jgi:2-polyprenyl-6-methoxyphenol hydroxylase-like FAD-dependent oxidoreductase
MDRENEIQVLIVGAGPTGLALALWLARFGVRIRIVDKTSDVAPISRALGVHARTLEFYRQLGFANEAIAEGVVMQSVNLWARDRRVASVPISDIGEGLTPFPFVLDLAQDEHEQLLIKQLALGGVTVERTTELTGLTQNGDGVVATLRHADGTTESSPVEYLAGCDGTHSTVRGALGVPFAGGTYEHLFYVADVRARGPAVDSGVNVDLDEADLLAVFDMKGPGHIRLVGTVRGDAAARAERNQLSFDDVARRPLEHLRMEVEDVNWFSTYRVHHRVAKQFRVGRVFLLGDAAHVHSPVGAQGMNTGIGDAINLAWKLAAVVHGESPAALLDTYEPERIAFARRLVATTDRVFAFASKSGGIAGFVRTRLFPMVVSVVFRARAAKRYLFRTVSQIMINYRASTLSEGQAGSVHGGDRLPWAPLADGADNYKPLTSLRWQVHVYGNAPPGLREACTDSDVELHVFNWTSRMQESGFIRNGVYLVRPDGYVGLADQSGRAEVVREYFANRSLKPAARIAARA